MATTLKQAKKKLCRHTAGGVSENDPRVVDRIHSACSRLFDLTDFRGKAERYAFFAHQGCITLPYHLDTAIAANVRKRSYDIRNHWFEFMEAGPGQLDPKSYDIRALVDRGEGHPTYRDLCGPATLLKVYCDLPEAAGTRVLIQGLDENLNAIHTVDGGEWVEGEYVVLNNVTPPVTTRKFRRITQLIKPVTKGTVRVYAYTPYEPPIPAVPFRAEIPEALVTTNVDRFPQTTDGFFYPNTPADLTLTNVAIGATPGDESLFLLLTHDDAQVWDWALQTWAGTPVANGGGLVEGGTITWGDRVLKVEGLPNATVNPVQVAATISSVYIPGEPEQPAQFNGLVLTVTDVYPGTYMVSEFTEWIPYQALASTKVLKVESPTMDAEGTFYIRLSPGGGEWYTDIQVEGGVSNSAVLPSIGGEISVAEWTFKVRDLPPAEGGAVVLKVAVNYQLGTPAKDATQYAISQLAPNEEVPDLRRYLIPGVSPENPQQVTVLCNRRFVPPTKDTDRVYPGNLEALKLMILSIEAEEKGDYTASAVHQEKAVKQLRSELRQFLGPGATTPIQVQQRAWGASGLSQMR